MTSPADHVIITIVTKLQDRKSKGDNDMKKQRSNMVVEVTENPGTQNFVTVSDANTGIGRTWKLKIDDNCDFCYKIQKTQIKTIYCLSEIGKMIDCMLEHLPWCIAEEAGFKFDFTNFLEYERRAL
ncbi:MAG: hypothetical protein LUC91_01255 [Prevotella sp.]|nr:hypothetical protein [Prevotella sp.]